MAESTRDPTTRFTGLAEIYARGRPAYPDAAVQAILDRAKLGPKSLLIDVGSGTGIASRQFAASGVPVIGIEPNDDMRRQAIESPGPTVDYRAGQAEATGLDDAIANAVISAQAFHWFEPNAALQEFHRILKPGGWVALFWNERDEADPFTAEYGDIIRTSRDAAAHETARGRAGDVLAPCPLFTNYERLTFPFSQALDAKSLQERAFSVSYGPPDDAGREAWRAALTDVFNRYQHAGKVELRYVTTLHLACRPPS